MKAWQALGIVGATAVMASAASSFAALPHGHTGDVQGTGLPLAGGTLTGALVVPDGLVSAPSIRGSDADSGISFTGSGKSTVIGVDGAAKVEVGASLVTITGLPSFPTMDIDATAGSCTNGVFVVDTGATPELCYCAATNTYYCVSFTDLTGPND